MSALLEAGYKITPCHLKTLLSSCAFAGCKMNGERFRRGRQSQRICDSPQLPCSPLGSGALGERGLKLQPSLIASLNVTRPLLSSTEAMIDPISLNNIKCIKSDRILRNKSQNKINARCARKLVAEIQFKLKVSSNCRLKPQRCFL